MGKFNEVNFSRRLKQMKTPTLEDLKKAGDEAYATQLYEDERLLSGYDDKLLKSKTLIAKAKKLKAAKVAKEKKETEKKEASE